VDDEQLLEGFRHASDEQSVQEWGELLLARATAVALSLSPIKPSDRRSGKRALHMFRTLLGRVHDATNPDLQTLAGQAQIGIYVALSKLRRMRESTAEKDKLLSMGEPALRGLEETARCLEGQDGISGGRNFLVTVLGCRIAVLGDLDREGEAEAASEEFIKRFEHDKSRLVQFWVKGIRGELENYRASRRPQQTRIDDMSSTSDANRDGATGHRRST